MGIVKIDASEAQTLLQFGPKTTVDPVRIIELVQKQRHIRMAGQDKLRAEITAPQVSQRVDAVRRPAARAGVAVDIPSIATP